MSTPLKLLSAGAVKRGVAQIAAAYQHVSGNAVEVDFTQVPKMRSCIDAGEIVDVVVATTGAMDAFAAAGKIEPATRALVGRSR